VISLDKKTPHSLPLMPFLVLYRRALAREGSSLDIGNPLSHEMLQATLVEAIDDLRRCMNVLEESQHADQQKQKPACQTALQRLEKSYNQLREKKKEMPTTNGNASHSSPERNRLGNVAEQKQDIMRLLLARQMAKASPQGEAFFLLDWKWWRQWCEHVDFFYLDDKNGQQSEKRTLRVLKMLPSGAVLPNDDGDSDDDSSEDSSTQQALGPIDNSRLLMGDSTYLQQWYNASAETPPLCPNLVRGYHYELLPREVYNALRTWYGESTPSICRRTTEERVVILYPGKNNGLQSRTPQRCSACRAPVATARCKLCMSVQYCNRACQEAHWPFHKGICKTFNGSNNGTERPPQHEGKIGLNNVGNTCFMNCALQCLSHATPLTRHFLSNTFKSDVNTKNPLGSGGKLALAYDNVMKEIWMKVKSTAISPTALRRAIALFAPRFAGCLQHDAQEFLAYLLDGLHEDLNRIVMPPYVEMPDVTDGHNMAIAGARAWDAHKRRNDSLVLDTFYGQFQSTCVCPKCQKVSVSFDTFNHVSLEIPQMHKMTVTIPILLFPAEGGQPPCRYAVTLPRQSSIADVKHNLAGMARIPLSNLMLCDVYNHSIYELLHDKKLAGSVRPNDTIAAFEAEPYTTTSFHAVAMHSMKVTDQGGEEKRVLFGFPLMTSFDIESSCNQIWEHFWKIVGHMAIREGSVDGYIDTEKKYLREDVLQIHVIDGKSRKPLGVFPSSDGKRTSLLPVNSSDILRECLGDDCTTDFLFLSLEWKNTKTNDGSLLIDPELFVAHSDHQSLIDAIKVQRTNSGTKGVSLDQCFETFTKPERLDENNMWYCSKCKEHVRALKTMILWRLPNILVVHLKRFEFKHALRRDKLDTFVDFPLEGLDMTRHCGNWESPGDGDKPFVDAGIPAEYDLFGVMNHYGRLGFGHYTAFARRWDETGMSSDFALFDDSSVRNVGSEPDVVVTPAAYVLFYRRRTFN
jgi:ubiquitin C-terminal hydrolase